MALLAEDLACLHDIFEGHKVFDAPVQPNLGAGGGTVRLSEVQRLPSCIHPFRHAAGRYLQASSQVASWPGEQA